MPKSKRNKLVTLSKTQKKGRAQKESMVDGVRASFDEFGEMYVFEFQNMRNTKFKEFREELKASSRFFLGSNKVLQVALGKDAANEHRDNTHKASELLEGHRGLLFTNLPKEEIVRRFEEYEELDFARTGAVASQTVELPEGPLPQFTHDMEPFLRKQGMPVRLNKGVVELVAPFTVCTDGEPISPEASKVLRLLGIQMAPFRMHLVARWTPDSFEVLQEDGDEAVEGAMAA